MPRRGDIEAWRSTAENIASIAGAVRSADLIAKLSEGLARVEARYRSMCAHEGLSTDAAAKQKIAHLDRAARKAAAALASAIGDTRVSLAVKGAIADGIQASSDAEDPLLDIGAILRRPLDDLTVIVAALRRIQVGSSTIPANLVSIYPDEPSATERLVGYDIPELLRIHFDRSFRRIPKNTDQSLRASSVEAQIVRAILSQMNVLSRNGSEYSLDTLDLWMRNGSGKGRALGGKVRLE